MSEDVKELNKEELNEMQSETQNEEQVVEQEVVEQEVVEQEVVEQPAVEQNPQPVETSEKPLSKDVDLEKIVKDYLDASKKQSAKRLNFFDEIYSKVRRGNRENVEAFRTIEKAYLDELKEEKEMFDNLKLRVDALNKDLTNALNKYNNSYDIKAEEKKLEDNKEKGILPKQQIYRKEAHDNSFKLDRILKEEKDTLKIKQDALEECEKNHLLKRQELERKERIEINKEKSLTLSKYDDLQKSLLNTNNRKEIKKINKQIQEIQKVGIANEKKIKLSYVNLIKQEDEAYLKEHKDILIDIENTNKDYAIKKEACDLEKKQINLRYAIELDKYDFGSKRALNNLNKKMIAKKNAIIVSNKEATLAEANKYRDEDRIHLEKRHSYTKDFEKVMDANYKAFSDTVSLGRSVITNVYFEEEKNIHEFLNVLVNNIFFMISKLHQEYVLNVIDNEYSNIKLFIAAKYSYETLVKKDYKAYIDRLQKAYDEFKEESIKKGHEFELKLDSIYDECINGLNSIFNKINDAWKELDNRESYHERLKALLNEGLKETISYDEAYYKAEYDAYQYGRDIEADFENAKKDANKENEEVSLVHDEADKKLDDEISKYNASKDEERIAYDEESKDKVKEIEDKSKEEIDRIMKEYNDAMSKLSLDETSEKQKIESDYKTQINLLK